ncbi:DUF4424 domain-containing protein [Caulobacter sp. NIBR1757]|uniref:DUF4424 domain-containing protein n=1 Tax=Caulobacter sp. NIBR1757 TaxID=3016000 RepID=UPI0022F1415F|nr:DUF4424 domain-containing protein [Caulobacter sp. NIBR1757]WGM39603.1 hypothetical protein AMEJIAPC_02528 [Caulobacter sp. NIBR1757]
MKRQAILTAAIAATLLAAPALANDSTAELAAGGLILKTTDSIEMRSEDLFISQKEVVVKYRFQNTSAAPVSTVVAFPMPDIGGEGFFESDNGLPSDDATNLLQFHTLVDGKPVKAQVEQKAIVKGVDRTAWLKAHGIPLAAHRPEAGKALDALGKADKDEAVRLGIAWISEYDAGKGWESHAEPAWVLKTTFYWTQVFPAGKIVEVEHRYIPAVGGSVDTIVGMSSDDAEFRATIDAERKKYCVDQSFLAALNKARPKAEGSMSGYTEKRIGYVLKTGANWAKPIGDFRLVIDKGAPDNLVSFCATGVKKIAPTRFEVVKKDYRPDSDLEILILEPLRAE